MTAPMDTYYAGELSGLLYAGELATQTASSAANHVLRVSRRVKPTGDCAREMMRMARSLDDAAANYRAAAALAFPATALMAAE